MKQVSFKRALAELEYNYQRAKKFPKLEEEFSNEYMYSDPNDFEEMERLYSYYGYKYSRSIWALQQVQFNQAQEDMEKRLANS